MSARSRFFCTVSILPVLFVPSVAAAQSVTLDPPPVRQPLDENGVDLSTGEIVPPSSTLAIGGSDGLVHSRQRVGNGWRHSYMISAEIAQGQAQAALNIGNSRRTFTLSGSLYVCDQDPAEFITPNFTTGTHVYTARNGTQIILKSQYVSAGQSYYGPADALGDEIVAPDGKREKLHYRNDSYTLTSGGSTITIFIVRLSSVTSNTGYQLQYQYVSSTPSSVDDWYRIQRVTAVNNSVEYCDPTATSCSFANVWPYLEYAETTSGTDTLETVTDVLSRQARFRTDSSSRLTGVKRAGESSDGFSVTYDANSRVSSITRAGGYLRTYSWSIVSGNLVASSNDTLGRQQKATTEISTALLKSTTDALSNPTQYFYDTIGNLHEVVAPEGNSVVIDRDTRGRITQVTRNAKPGSPLADIIRYATYPTLTSGISCAVAVTCDSPLTTTDERGFVTNYTYDTSHGGVTQVLRPADVNSIRPRVDVTYVTQYAKVKDAGGTLVQLTDGVVRPASATSCRNNATCSGTGDAMVTELAYNNASAPNLQTVSVTQRVGDNSASRSSSFTYDNLGNVLIADGPLSGSDDTTRTHYDAAGEVVGRVGGDPDGAGGVARAAQRYTLNADGQVTVTEVGTAPGTSDTDWSSFSPLGKMVTDYDAAGRRKSSAQVAISGTTQYSVAQFSYDAAGRPTCVAQRLNAPSTSTTLPTDACTAMTAGTAGPDRISQTFYDALDRPTEAWSGIGTALAQRTARASYNGNGTLATLDDAGGNRTTYEYDGFDRQAKVRYPDLTRGSLTSSTTIYDQYSYDPGSNVLSWRKRDGSTLQYEYDDLGRLIVKDVPTRSGLATTHTRDVYYTWDLMNRPATVRFNSTGGEGEYYLYDGLGRRIYDYDNMDWQATAMTSWYNSVDARTDIRYPDGNILSFVVDNLGRRTSLYEPGIWLMNHGYDALGRENLVARKDYANTYRLFDASLRMDRMDMNGPDPSNDLRSDYYYNQASQIVSRIRSNDAFSFTAHTAVDRPYTANGLNQYDTVSSTGYCYDANGNLTGDGTYAYLYDVENRLVEMRDIAGTGCAIAYTGTLKAALRYDPLGRLHEAVNYVGGVSQGPRRFRYDGNDLIAEYDGSGAMLRRYAHWDDSTGDDPQVWWEGSGMGNSARRFLIPDERGSITKVTDGSGDTTAINAYDEFGTPDDASMAALATKGSFRYTGQVWLPEVGLYYYKARMYSPKLGRFMQSDPIGYADGMNTYAYVINDPTSLVDPSGLDSVPPNSDGSCPQGRTKASDGQCWKETIVVFGGMFSGLSGGIVIGGGGGPSGGSPPNARILGVIVVTADPTLIPPCKGAGCLHPDVSTWHSGPPVKENLFGTHWCGFGGGGPTTSVLDEACKAHDECYAANGLTAGSNFNPFADDSLRTCNQALCDASEDQGTPGFLVRKYFTDAPWPRNACRRGR